MIKMRPQQFEFGVEREYAIFGEKNNQIGYLLAVENILSILRCQIKSNSQNSKLWNSMYKKGWRIMPEYSHCLIEVISPPFVLDEWGQLAKGFFYIEKWLQNATVRLASMLKFNKITCTSKYSVRTDLFFSCAGC